MVPTLGFYVCLQYSHSEKKKRDNPNRHGKEAAHLTPFYILKKCEVEDMESWQQEKLLGGQYVNSGIALV
jgi:hypothetical protein